MLVRRYMSGPEVLEKYRGCRASMYAAMRIERWPRQVVVGSHGVSGLWLEHEVDAVVAARDAGWSGERIQDLVRKLAANREARAQEAVARALGLDTAGGH